MTTGEGKVRKTSFFCFPGSVAFDQQVNSKKTKFKKKICMFKQFTSTKFNQKIKTVQLAVRFQWQHCHLAVVKGTWS